MREQKSKNDRRRKTVQKKRFAFTSGRHTESGYHHGQRQLVGGARTNEMWCARGKCQVKKSRGKTSRERGRLGWDGSVCKKAT